MAFVRRGAVLKRAAQCPSLGLWIPLKRVGIDMISQRPTHIRSVTNATKPDHFSSLHSVTRVAEKPGGWHPTLVHSSGEVKWTVIRLQPDGGEVPKHSHSVVWDYFVPLEGEAVIETETKEGVKQDFEMVPGSFLAVGPDDVHRVRNRSKEKEFVFLIAQAPRAKYDFVAR